MACWKPYETQDLTSGSEPQAPVAFDGEDIPVDETAGAESQKNGLINSWQAPVIKIVESKGMPEVDETQHQDVLHALTKKRGHQQTSLMFKRGEIRTSGFQWPEIEEQPSEQEIAQVVTDLFEGLVSGNASEIVQGLMDSEKPINREVLERARSLAEEQARQAVDQARTGAEQIIQNARQEAEELLAQANQDYAGIVQRARQEGMEDVNKEAIPILQAARTVVEQTQKWHEYVLSQSESAVLGLVKEIAQRLLGAGIVLESEVLGKLFAEAVAEAKPLGALRIRLHPADIEVLEPHWVEQQSALTSQQIEFSPSNNILRGGCLIEGEFGILDAQVNTKLQRVLDTLAEVEAQPVEAPQEEELLAELPISEEKPTEIPQGEEQANASVDTNEQRINSTLSDEQSAGTQEAEPTEQSSDIIDQAEQAIQSIETTRQSAELSDLESRIFGSGGQT